MRKAFDPKDGPLTDMQADDGEKEARFALFAGAIGSYKNPHSRRDVHRSRRGSRDHKCWPTIFFASLMLGQRQNHENDLGLGRDC